MKNQVTKNKDGWTTVITNEITKHLNQLTAEARAKAAPRFVSTRQQANYLEWDYTNLVYSLIRSRGSFLQSSAEDMYDQVMSDLLGYTLRTKDADERAKSVVELYFEGIETASASFLSFFRIAAYNRISANIQRGKVPISGYGVPRTGEWECERVYSVNAIARGEKDTDEWVDNLPSTLDVEKEVTAKFTFIKPIRDFHNKLLMNGKKVAGKKQTRQLILADIVQHTFIEHLDSLAANAIISKKYEIPTYYINGLRRELVHDIRKILGR